MSFQLVPNLVTLDDLGELNTRGVKHKRGSRI